MNHKLIIIVVVLAILHSAHAGSICTRGTYTANNCQYTVHTRDEYVALSTNVNYVFPSANGLIQTGPGSKILFDLRDYPNHTDIWFFSGKDYPSHGNLISALGMDAEYSAAPNDWFRCDWALYIDVDGSPIFAMTINVGVTVTPERMRALAETIKPVLPLCNVERCAYVSNDPVRQVFDAPTRAYYTSLGMETWYRSELDARGAEVFYNPLKVGEAWGALKLFPDHSNTYTLAPTDIPIFNQLPLDLSVVSGVITTVYQTVNSHVNLKSNERDTPNMVLLNYPNYQDCIANFTNKSVHLAVAADGWTITPSTPDEVVQKRAEKLASKPWLSLFHDVGGKCRSFDDFCNSTSASRCLERKKMYGTKAANMAFLLNRQVFGKTPQSDTLSNAFGYDIAPIGFGIPFQYYVDFVNYPPNKLIKQKILELNELYMSQEVPPEITYQLSNELKLLHWDAEIPPHILTDIRNLISQVFTPRGMKDLKFRSSSNAEDLPGFNGAGLYDSFSAETDQLSMGLPCRYNATKDDMVPDTIECALKGVYGSLWNARAIDERTFARYRHDGVAMGIAVVAAYKEYGRVTANAVAVTRYLINPEKVAYTFSLQTMDNDVTNPNPGTMSETSTAWIYPNGTYNFVIERYAVPVAGQPPLFTSVLTPNLIDDMMNITLHAERAYCIHKWKLPVEKCDQLRFYNAKTGLDLEFKFLSNRRVHCKQIREFTGAKVKTVVLPSVAPDYPCKWISPAYFVPPLGEEINNIVIGKPVSASQATAGTIEKGVDGVVAIAAATEVQVGSTGWWEVDLEGTYDVRYVRIVSPSSSRKASMKSFQITLNLADSTTHVLSYNHASTFVGTVQTFNVSLPPTKKVKSIRITSPGGIYFVELQVYAYPHYIGDPDDFILEPRPNIPFCSWSAWSDWTPCFLNPDRADVLSDCGPEAGIQSRTRSGDQYCDNYLLFTEKLQSQNCSFPCSPSNIPPSVSASSISPGDASSDQPPSGQPPSDQLPSDQSPSDQLPPSDGSSPPQPGDDSNIEADSGGVGDIPFWVWIVVGVGVLLIVAGILFYVFYWRKRQSRVNLFQGEAGMAPYGNTNPLLSAPSSAYKSYPSSNAYSYGR